MPRADVVLFVSRGQPVDAIQLGNFWISCKKLLKNVIFVLQQIDLREPTVNRCHPSTSSGHRDAGLALSHRFFRVARKALLAGQVSDKERLWEESAFAPSKADQLHCDRIEHADVEAALNFSGNARALRE